MASLTYEPYEKRREAALEKLQKVCHSEYTKYLEATNAARQEYYATIQQIDVEINMMLGLGIKYLATLNVLAPGANPQNNALCRPHCPSWPKCLCGYKNR